VYLFFPSPPRIAAGNCVGGVLWFGGHGSLGGSGMCFDDGSGMGPGGFVTSLGGSGMRLEAPVWAPA
jgi:hypothetical protein